MFIGSRQLISQIPSNFTISFDGVDIIPTTNVKNLGIYMDRYMTFEVHIDNMSRKVIGSLSFLNRNIHLFFDVQTRINVVKTLILSIINYCSSIWGMANVTQLSRVQKLQNFAAKVAYGGAKKRDHVSPIIEKLRWLKIDEKIEYDIAILVYKVLNHLLPSWLFNFQLNKNICSRHTRQSEDLHVQKANTNIGSNSFVIRGPKTWNSIQHASRCAPSLNSFKKQLYQNLMINRHRN